MSEYEMEMIRVLDQMGKTDWVGITVSLLGIVFSLVVPLVSAWIAFKISNNQITLQLTQQNKLETQKEKRMLSTKIRLDKYEELYDSLSEYTRLVNQSFFNIVYYIQPNEYYGERTLKQTREIEKGLQLEIGQKSKLTEILSSYHPEIRDDWDDMIRLYCDIANIIYDGFTYPSSDEPFVKDPSFEHLKLKHDLLNLKNTKICDDLTKATIQIIKDLESDL